MIFPLPVRSPSNEGRLRFIDLHDYERFFDDLENGIPDVQPWIRIGCSAPKSAGGYLELFEIRFTKCIG